MKPSPTLLELAKTYLAMVDETDEHSGTPERDAERTEAHEALMDELERCAIPFNSRYEARWIARWLMGLEAKTKPNLTQRVMWAKLNPFTDLVTETYFTPPNDNRDGLVPVMVLFLPFTYQPMVAERNDD